MENVMTIERKSNLIMPTHYVELDKDEMSYVDGGIYLNNGFCCAITGILGISALIGSGIAIGASAAKIAVAIKAAGFIGRVIGGITSFLYSNPITAFLGLALTAFFIINQENLLTLAGNIIYASTTGKGVEVGLGWFFSINSSVK